MSDDPLVSCVMPTKNRRAFIGAAIDCWCRQTYRNSELVIVDDGDDPVEDVVKMFRTDRIRYERIAVPIVLGKKRNYCNEIARGDLICHFDDDDWSAADRVEYQVEFLLASGKPMTGFSRLIFWDTIRKRAIFYQAVMPGYVVGTSMTYFRDHWRKHPFRAEQVATDHTLVCSQLRNIAASGEEMKMVARIHGAHTSGKSNHRERFDQDRIPVAFWENERARTGWQSREA